MYSGGVDSILCLKWLRDHGIIPVLFHFHTGKTKRRHERMIRKTAKLLSPESPYYVWKIKTSGYHVFWAENGEYHVKMNDRGPICTFMPQVYGIVVIGYTGYDSNDGRRKLRTQSAFIKLCERCNYPFVFPLANVQKSQINQLFEELPKVIRENTVSSTRFFKGEWEVVPNKYTHLYGQYLEWNKHKVP